METKNKKRLTLKEKVLGTVAAALLMGPALGMGGDLLYSGLKAQTQEATERTRRGYITLAEAELRRRTLMGYLPAMLLGTVATGALIYTSKEKKPVEE